MDESITLPRPTSQKCASWIPQLNSEWYNKKYSTLVDDISAEFLILFVFRGVFITLSRVRRFSTFNGAIISSERTSNWGNVVNIRKPSVIMIKKRNIFNDMKISTTERRNHSIKLNIWRFLSTTLSPEFLSSIQIMLFECCYAPCTIKLKLKMAGCCVTIECRQANWINYSCIFRQKSTRMFPQSFHSIHQV